MAGERVKLQVQERESRGSAESRRLRKQGLIPGVLYGRGKEPQPISIPERELRRVLTGGQGLHAILDVDARGPEDHPSVDPQGVPAAPGARRDDPHRPAGSAARPADPGAGRRRARGRAGRRHRGRRALAGQPRDHGRGAADGDSRAPRAGRDRDGDRRHAAPRRPRPAQRGRHVSSTTRRRRCSRR